MLRFLVDGVCAGRSGGVFGVQLQWENPVKTQSATEFERARVPALQLCFLRSEPVTWIRVRFHELRGKAGCGHCRINEAS